MSANFSQIPAVPPTFLCLPCISETDAVTNREIDSKFVECDHCKRLDHCLPTEGKLLGNEAGKVLDRLGMDFNSIFS